VIEFKKRCNTTLTIENQLLLPQLVPKEEFHLIQIIRESLINCAQHANATKATLTLSQQNDGTITVKVIDNGVGISEYPTKPNHYGLTILQERAQKLAGNIDISLNNFDGTTVGLIFKPIFFKKTI
jgi:nitrate/nitrite-specific signal transduction histidine kinase